PSLDLVDYVGLDQRTGNYYGITLGRFKETANGRVLDSKTEEHWKPAHGRAFVIAANEAQQDPNVVTGSSGVGNARGVKAPETLGCSYKTFLNCKAHTFNGNDGVVALSRWFAKME
nr:hypothetical protein [Tanacetum cinerariifolium]